jgi:hypothetical protein
LIDAQCIDNSVFKDNFAGINRNALYLHYKTYHETYVLKIGESLVWVKIKNGLIVGDIDCDMNDFNYVMAKLHTIALKLGLHRIQFHTSHQTKLSTLFAENYEAMPSYYILFKDLGSQIPLDKIKFTFADVDIF